jgi:zinc protease
MEAQGGERDETPGEESEREERQNASHGLAIIPPGPRRAAGDLPPSKEKPNVRSRSSLALVAALALAAAAPRLAAGKPGDVFPYPILQTTLGNGLEVVVVPYDSPGIVAYYSVVRTGSRDEVEPGHSGFAHFFEHMMSRGTDRYSKDRYAELLERMGADSNAFTTDDFTTFYIVGPAARLETMMDMESDRFKNLKYAEDNFRTESQAVLGEYNKGASSPFQPMEEKLRDLAFTAHTYRHTTIGFLADVQAMPGYYEYSRGFFARYYRPENVVLVVVGDVAAARVFDLARRFYGDWKPGYRPPPIPREPPQTAPREAHVDWPNPVRPQMFLAYHTPAFSTATPDSAALELAAQLLFAESSPLYQDLVVQRQWADSLSGGGEAHRDPYLFTISARVRSEDLLPKVQGAIEAALAGLAARPVDAALLARVQSHLRYALALSLDSPGAIARRLAGAIELTGDPQSINRLYERYDRITPEDIARVARQVFRPENRTVVTLSHRPAPAAARGGE